MGGGMRVPSGFVPQLISLLLSDKVPVYKKWLYLLLVAGYWLSPDLLPFIPLDDLLVTLLGSWLFIRSAANDLEQEGDRRRRDRNVIDVEGKVVEDDD